MEYNELTGYLLVNKPVGKSSYDCIRHIKKILKRKIKIGHAGTLDPFASGLLIIAIGRAATRGISHLANMEKTYVATGKLGEMTTTHDHTGETIETCVVPEITLNEMDAAVMSFQGEYKQIPPIYSALKHEGQPLYKLVRNKKLSDEQLKKITHGKQRTVTISAIKLLNFSLPQFTIETTASKGTYIRTLIYDIGQKLNVPATTYNLKRTAIGPYLVSNACKLDEFKDEEDIEQQLLTSPATPC